jgi:hypothetical protein
MVHPGHLVPDPALLMENPPDEDKIKGHAMSYP